MATNSNIPPQIANQYNRLKQQYSQIFKRFLQLQQQKRQNNLVLTNLQPLKGQRRCWKVMGGVLVQYTLTETTDSLKQQIDMLQQTLKALDQKMKKIQKQVFELEIKYNLNPNKKGSNPDQGQIKPNKEGLLA